MYYSTAELVVAGLIKYGPVVAAEIKNLLAKSDPTIADIDALLIRVQSLDQASARAKAEAEYRTTHPNP